ncbi:MAG: DNA methylase [Syntrophomonadaceae bacterium]|nr:DNA methylase [Syntrophomonadaceae bacterium]
MAKYNDLDMKSWKQYEDIYTDSLWIIEKRDNSGAHKGDYHGNFIPQIPNQLFRRYTKMQDWILDPFMGSGTSIIEAQRLERNYIGIELDVDVATAAKDRILNGENINLTTGKVCIGDSRTFNIAGILDEVGINKVQFVILHPPYWDIIKFTEHKKDLSNTKTIEEFLQGLGEIIDNTCQHLEKDRYCALVMGDKYANKELVPLGFRTMNLFLERGFILKAILVKNFEETRGKANQRAIWRYRALASDFYIFKHEYIFVFKKVE